MAAVVHSPPELGRLRQAGRTSRKPECESFVDEIVNGISANKRPKHGIDGFFRLLVALEFLECFAIAEDHDHTEIERLFQVGTIPRNGPGEADLIDAAHTADRA